MTIHYRKVLKSIGWVAVCLFGIEQVAFATDDTSTTNEPKSKGSYYSRAKRAAGTAKDEVQHLINIHFF